MSVAKRNSALSRRLILQGAGVAMALPWLESLPVWGREAATAKDAPRFPQRFAALFMACGVNTNHWWATGAGDEMELGKSLEPMIPYRNKMNFVHG